MQVLAPGIIVFNDTIDFNDKIINLFDQLKQTAIDENYNFIKDHLNKVLYGINKSGHRIPVEDINKTCVRISNILAKKEYNISPINDLEEILYKLLLKYIEKYPQVLPCIWWKTKGHGLIYSNDSSLGLHSDNDINYMPGAEPDYQLGLRHVLAAICYFNTSGIDYVGGEINFPYYNVTYSPKAGDVLFFPSNFLAAHEVNLIKQGVRYCYLEYYGQGSSDPERGISISNDSDNVTSGQVWLNNLPLDYKKYIIDKYGESNLGELLRPIRDNYPSSNTKEELNAIQ